METIQLRRNFKIDFLNLCIGFWLYKLISMLFDPNKTFGEYIQEDFFTYSTLYHVSVFFGVALLVSLLFSRKKMVIINETSIYFYSQSHAYPKVPWENIASYEIIKSFWGNSLLIYLKDPEAYILSAPKASTQKFLRKNLRKNNTPVVITLTYIQNYEKLISELEKREEL